ncbi:MAG: MG2 domain-containing protein [Alcaligenaceae bacterium]
MMNTIKFLAFVILLGFASLSQAATITRFSPQGTTSNVRQIVVDFDRAVVTYGEAKLPAPVEVQCSLKSAAEGSGRWLNERSWAYDFVNEVPAGVVCQAELTAQASGFLGGSIQGDAQYSFNTGGPIIERAQPGRYGPIVEDQIFVLRLTGPATLASIRTQVWCAVEGLGERVSVRLISGPERDAIIQASYLQHEANREPLSVVTLACNRRLPASAKIQLVYGRGIASAVKSGSEIKTTTEQRLDFTVREPFSANFTCERENARSGCIPILPLTLNFNAPVSASSLKSIRLTSGTTTYPAILVDDSGTSMADTQSPEYATAVQFSGVLPENTEFMIELPRSLKDDSERLLSNATSFPFKVTTGAMPALAKFAAAPFGVIERLAEKQGVGILPLTVRNVEAHLNVKELPVTQKRGKVTDLRLNSDADIIAWYRKTLTYNSGWVDRKQAQQDAKSPLPPVVYKERENEVETRSISLISQIDSTTQLELPAQAATDKRPFEVIGVPLTSGFHVVEIASQQLGQSLLDERYGEARTMYVRTSALVTNLGVHFKLGRENSVAWVTTLDQGLPVAGASVQISDCHGRALAQAVTDSTGIATFKGISPQAPLCNKSNEYLRAYFVSARAPQPQSLARNAALIEDIAFTWTNWDKGIEPWRFNVPTSQDITPDRRAHTIFDRTLVRAGDAVSMKHILRAETSHGFDRVAKPPSSYSITHVGSGQEYKNEVLWSTSATGGQSAQTTFTVPRNAKLGLYKVAMIDKNEIQESGEFRVEEFRLPIFSGQIKPDTSAPLVRIQKLPIDVQVGYVSGGAAANLPVQVSALVRDKALSFASHEDFIFKTPRGLQSVAGAPAQASESQQGQRLVANKLPLTLDKLGNGKLTIESIPTTKEVKELLLEATYADPSGEVQTIRKAQTLWPAQIVAGIKTESWVSVGETLKLQALALDLAGQAQPKIALEVTAISRRVESTRKRMVGGFYSYDNQTITKDLGTVCRGTSDSRGLLTCNAKLDQAGEVELIVTARDTAGNQIQAATSVYVTHQGEIWFGADDHDRMDVLPEKKTYQPGETAKFQVRMPFRQATALVAIEREGILETRVVELKGDDPTISVEVKAGWSPNVYVSVLALRGRLRIVPWYSFFTWGYRAPTKWWADYSNPDNNEFVAPTSMIDLSKPTYRFGLGSIQVGDAAHRLNVKVETDRTSYPVRDQAQVTVTVTLPNRQPAAHAEIALAAVDQALLELMPNKSWNLLEAMLVPRAWGVATSTAQMEIVGRRHYGRKAVPAGGGGGRHSTRELLDTLLLWNPKIVLDEKGQAQVTVPLNDALTTFEIVAIADLSTGLFGTGKTTIQSTQDLQIISGLPPLVREGDQYQAQVTLRNTTDKLMKLVVEANHQTLSLPAQSIELEPRSAGQVSWSVTVASQTVQPILEAFAWQLRAKDSVSQIQDTLKVNQRVTPAVPVTVQQATLVQLDGPYALEVKAPSDALAQRGGIKLSFSGSLTQGLPSVRAWLAKYPFSCLEQSTSKALGMRDQALWAELLTQLPGYLDKDGLATYFPTRAGDSNRGSDTLTAYLLSAAAEANTLDSNFGIPPNLAAPMLEGLSDFVQGKIERQSWSNQSDLDVRKLAALEALSRYGRAQPKMLESIELTPKRWPTHAVIDWLNILNRMPNLRGREQHRAQANQVLRSRLVFQGSRVGFSTERDDAWWWLMQNGDVNAARLLLLTLTDSAWRNDSGRLITGLISRQQKGAWSTTTANLWGSLALEQFAKVREGTPVTGKVGASLGQTLSVADLSIDTSASMLLAWPVGEQAEMLNITPVGTGRPWVGVQSLAAIPLTAPRFAGFQIKRSVSPIEQADKTLPPGTFSRGDILRVTLEINASSAMTWVALTDSIPAGATILGSGLGRDSQIATKGEQQETNAWLAYQERSLEALRAYYEYMPAGISKLQYTIRLNSVGTFSLPPSRVEAMYAPEMFGETPNSPVVVR